MTVRTLREPLTGYRIGDPDGDYPIWDAGGALREAGRWHETGAPVIYASEHYATALLEKLVHHNGRLPKGQHFIEITIPAGTSYEVVTKDSLPGWHTASQTVSRRFGRSWVDAQRSAVLIMPSVVARMERNFVFNTAHPQFNLIQTGLETPVWWDTRLFEP